MSDARIKLEILYKDVLDDIGELLDKVDAVKNTLPQVASEVESQLKQVVGQISQSINQLQNNKEHLIQQAQLTVNDAAHAKTNALVHATYLKPQPTASHVTTQAAHH